MVLVIIGLLLGAVLRGQELIASARVSNLISNMNGYKAAFYAFQDRYRITPGNSSTAATKVGNGADNCNAYCDDGLVWGWRGTNLVNNHLLAAGLYSGPALAAVTNALPTSEGYLNNPGGGPIHFHWSWYYLNSTGQQATGNNILGLNTGGGLSSKLLGELDRKLDDGNGRTDSIRAATILTQGASGCVDSSTGVWIENNPGTNCGAVELLP